MIDRSVVDIYNRISIGDIVIMSMISLSIIFIGFAIIKYWGD